MYLVCLNVFFFCLLLSRAVEVVCIALALTEVPVLETCTI